MQVGVGVKLARDEVLDLPGGGCVDICEAVDLGVDGIAIRVGARRWCLADVEGKSKHELVIVAELQQEGRRAGVCRQVRILQTRQSASQFRGEDEGRPSREHGTAKPASGAGRTCINSTGELSPAGRDADTLVAGNALGEMMMDVRFRVLLMTSDAIDTTAEERRVSAERIGQDRRQQGQRRDSHRFWSLR